MSSTPTRRPPAPPVLPPPAQLPPAQLPPEAGSRAAPDPRLQRLRRWTVASGLVLLAATVAWVLYASTLLAVDTVAVSGAVRATPAEVRAAAAVEEGTPLARVDTDAVAARVRALRPVADVEVGRGWPGTLRVRVVERQPVAWLLDGATTRLVDASGVVFATAAAPPPGTVRLQVHEPGPGPGDPTTRAALDVLAALPASLRQQVAIVRAYGPRDVVLLVRDGRRVTWGAPERHADKAAAAEALLKLPARSYDVRSPEIVTRTG